MLNKIQSPQLKLLKWFVGYQNKDRKTKAAFIDDNTMTRNPDSQCKPCRNKNTRKDVK